MRKLGFGIMALIGMVVILGVSSVATFSVNSTTRTFTAAREVQQADTDVVYELKGSHKGKDKSANSTVCPGVEADDKMEKAWNDPGMRPGGTPCASSRGAFPAASISIACRPVIVCRHAGSSC